MKKIILILKTEISDLPLLITHIVVLLFVVHFSMQYFSGNKGTIEGWLRDAEYFYEANIEIPFTQDIIDSLWNKEGIGYMEIYEDTFVEVDEQHCSVSFILGTLTERHRLSGNPFTTDQRENSDKVCYITYLHSILTKKSEGDTISIDNTDYVIVGLIDLDEENRIILPDTTFLSSYTPNRIRIAIDATRISKE